MRSAATRRFDEAVAIMSYSEEKQRRYGAFAASRNKKGNFRGALKIWQRRIQGRAGERIELSGPNNRLVYGLAVLCPGALSSASVRFLEISTTRLSAATTFSSRAGLETKKLPGNQNAFYTAVLARLHLYGIKTYRYVPCIES